MNSRERVRKAINHQQPDRVPIDFGCTCTTGIQASSYAKLKKSLGIMSGKTRIYEPFQMLAEVEASVMKMTGADVYGIQMPWTFLGYKNENWKPFRLFDGTEAEMSGHFTYDVLPNGDIVQYPHGDRSVPPSVRMPKDGYYFDSIVRQEPIDETKLDPKEWVEQFDRLYSDEELRFLEDTSKWWYENSMYSLLGSFWGADFGNISFVPGPGVLHPKGIRDPEEWYMSFITRKSYISEIFQLECELQMKNLKMYKQAVGERIDVVAMSGADFGSQNGPIYAPQTYREMFKPLHKKMNDWVHANTSWKTWYHTCGSIVEYLEDFAQAGIDVLNPVQISAAGMTPEFLKGKWGDTFVFWGGGIDSQHTLPFGTPEDVRREVRHNISVFSQGGGYVFANVHNIQSNIPIENIIAFFEEARGKPLSV